jgi:hypothetical protein
VPTPPPLESDAWYDELAALGVSRAALDAVWAERVPDPTLLPSPHELKTPEGPALLKMAFWLRYHQHAPGYAALMQLRMDAWLTGDLADAAHAWAVKQFAAMLLHGPQDVRDSADYGLWVDYFEVPADAAVMFPGLLAHIPVASWGPLLSHSGPVPWAVKRAAFAEAAQVKALQGAVALGLLGSIYDVMGRVDMAEAARLVESLPMPESEARSALEEAVSGPLLVQVAEAWRVKSTTAPWPGCYVLKVQLKGRPRWIAGSELRWDGRVWGVVRHFDPPMPAESSLERHVFSGMTPGGLNARHVHFRVEGSDAEIEALLGQQVESWPPGLFKALAH